uniref:Fetuin B n=1 Tax=Pipistrellus kuhlii TaxID=59472 RepID=A0A7J8A740_PIPKU|nr:fetuin B [Pipistrellus kuhlii]
MGLLLLLVLSILALCCSTTSVPQEVPRHSPFFLRGCNDADMLAMAAFVLQDINNDLKEGYVLSLNRVSAVQEHKQVYGQCKALYYVNMPLRILYLPAYNCTLRPVSRSKIQNMCPDCPIPANLSDPKVLETATETLERYNRDSESEQYSLVKVTHASSQWMFGLSYFVEYLIKESPCIDTTICGYQPTDSGPVGICRGSLGRRFEVKLVNINCDFFKSQALIPGKRKFAVYRRNKKPAQAPSKAVLNGSVQYLPELDDAESQEVDPEEAFPVHLDLTTNPQGEPLDVDFLFRAPLFKKLIVLPFPKEEQPSTECPGRAYFSNPIILPPSESHREFRDYVMIDRR